MGQQMKNNYVLRGWSKLPGQCAGRRGVYAPGRRELSVVEERSLEFNDFQHLGKNVHEAPFRTLRKDCGTLNQLIVRQMQSSKNPGRQNNYFTSHYSIFNW